MGKVRFQMLLDEEQKRTLEMLQRDTKIPMAEIIRDAIIGLIADYKKTKKLLAVVGVCKGGPNDLADWHDKYLYGMKKK